jgi:hypothetical protein
MGMRAVYAAVAAAAVVGASSTPLWSGTCGDGTRSGVSPVPLSKTLVPGARLPALGKSHGAPAVSSVSDDVFFVAWNSTGPFLYAWREGGSVLDAFALPNDGSDIMSDSFDALILGGGGGQGGEEIVCASVSYYNMEEEVRERGMDDAHVQKEAAVGGGDSASPPQRLLRRRSPPPSPEEAHAPLAPPRSDSGSGHGVPRRLGTSTTSLTCLHAANLTRAWHVFPMEAAIDAAAVVPSSSSAVSSSSPLVLVTFLSAKRSLVVRDLATGRILSSLPLYPAYGCDWRGSMAVSGDGTRAYLLCLDTTFKKNTILAVDLTKSPPVQIFSTAPLAALNSYWPPTLALWEPAGLLLGLTDRDVFAFDPSNGTLVWRRPLPQATVAHLLAFAATAATSSSSSAAAPATAPTPLLYLLTQSPASTAPVSLWALNASGGIVGGGQRAPGGAGSPLLLGLRVDQFSGTLIADPSGLAVTVNGWDPNTPGQPPTLARATLDPATGAWTPTAFPSFPLGTSGEGRLAIFAAPRGNGSVVVAGWEGVYQWN